MAIPSSHLPDNKDSLIIDYFPKKGHSVILSTLLVILAYLMGSICSAVIVCKMFSLPDPRTEGSKNPGATNVLRLAGKKYAVLVLVTDLLKGTIPVLIAKIFITDPMAIGFVALAAVIGHMHPVFFGFKGGKGVATAIGALLGFQFIVGVMVAGTWLIVARVTRFSSLASLISICLSPFYALAIISNIEVIPPLFLMALLIAIKHKNNIYRLIDKTEPKIQLKQRSVLDEVMDDEPDATYAPAPMPIVKEKIVYEVEPTVTKKPVATKAEKKPVTKAKATKKPAVKADNAEQKEKSAKKPTPKKAKVTKLKEEK